MKILVTGGCGFIGSTFINLFTNTPGVDVMVNLDAMTYAADEENIYEEHRNNPKYVFCRGDINDYERVTYLIKKYQIDTVVHFAAESHVDRSIKNADVFIKTNVNGTFNLLEICRRQWEDNFEGKRFLHVSTDEVFGALGPLDAPFNKNTPYKPNSPYAASKAASDLLVRSYYKTHGFPAVITNCSNNFGPNQHNEKLIPLVIKRIGDNQPIPVYGTGENVRDWIFVEDHCIALWKVLKKAENGSQHLIGGETEISNINLIHVICDLIGRGKELITFVEDRKGHDFRYSIDTTEFKKQIDDFKHIPFEVALKDTIIWYSRRP